jgi:hypothetical protein
MVVHLLNQIYMLHPKLDIVHYKFLVLLGVSHKTLKGSLNIAELLRLLFRHQFM